MGGRSLRPKIRFQVFERDNFTCQYCGRTPEMGGVVLEVDHIISIKDGGNDSLTNLTTSCFDCNRGKGAKSKPKKTIKQIEENIDMEQERVKQLIKLNNRNKKLIKLEKQSKELSRQWIYDIIGSDLNDNIYSGIESTIKKYGKTTCREALVIINQKSFKQFDTVKQWLGYYNGICRNIIADPRERELLLKYQPYLQTPFSNGIYNWRIKKSYDDAKKAILEFKDFSDDFHDEVITRFECGIKESLGQSFITRPLTKKYTDEEEYTIYKSGKNVNIFLVESLVEAYEYLKSNQNKNDNATT